MAKASLWNKFTRRRIWVRNLVQIFFFALIALISVNHTLAESGKGIPFLSSASLHALCPFGGVVTIYQYALSGTFIQKTHESAFILMIVGFVLAILFGPVFCGWICPLGSVQEWFGRLGKMIFKRRYNRFIPAKFDRWLRYLRYLVLAWIIYMTAASGSLVFAEFDPYFTLFNLWSSEIAIGGLIILAVTLIGSLFIERPWCKYACPYGAVLGVSNLFRIFRIRRVVGTCKLDGACDIYCPMNIKVSDKTIIRDHQCISCLECTSEARCPAAGTVDFVAGAK